jgi:hypothetical protein
MVKGDDASVPPGNASERQIDLLQDSLAETTVRHPRDVVVIGCRVDTNDGTALSRNEVDSSATHECSPDIVAASIVVAR